MVPPGSVSCLTRQLSKKCQPSPLPITAMSSGRMTSIDRRVSAEFVRSSGSRRTSRLAPIGENAPAFGGASGGEDDVSGAGAYTHLTMLAETTAGMHNLFRVASLASIEGFYFKPRMDRELLQTYASGLIATTGCASGEVQTLLRLGKYDQAVQAASDFRDIFGDGNYFCELMDHGLDIERRGRDDLLRLAKQLGCRSWPAMTSTTPARPTPMPMPRCCACSLHQLWPTPRDSSSMPMTSTSNLPPRCARYGETFLRRATTPC